jgi:putative endonuclease
VSRRPRQRTAAEQRGRLAESFALLLLVLKGYRIRARRLRRPPIEIDILAEKAGTLVLVEVKYRATLDEAVRALSPDAVRRLVRAAEILAQESLARRIPATGARVDLIALAPFALPRHIRGLQQ